MMHFDGRPQGPPLLFDFLTPAPSAGVVVVVNVGTSSVFNSGFGSVGVTSAGVPSSQKLTLDTVLKNAVP